MGLLSIHERTWAGPYPTPSSIFTELPPAAADHFFSELALAGEKLGFLQR